MTTDFDRLQAAWSALEQRVETQDARLLHVERTGRLDGLRRRLRPTVVGQWLQLGLGIALAALGGSVWPDGHSALVTASAIAIHVYGIACIAWSVATLAGLARLDYGAPVIELQTRLLKLQRLHLLGSVALSLVWWILWIPFAITLFGAMGGDYMGHIGGALNAIAATCAAGLGLSVVALVVGWRHPRSRRVLRRTFLGERLYDVGEALRQLR